MDIRERLQEDGGLMARDWEEDWSSLTASIAATRSYQYPNSHADRNIFIDHPSTNTADNTDPGETTNSYNYIFNQCPAAYSHGNTIYSTPADPDSDRDPTVSSAVISPRKFHTNCVIKWYHESVTFKRCGCHDHGCLGLWNSSDCGGGKLSWRVRRRGICLASAWGPRIAVPGAGDLRIREN
ncbi:hypothetical protein G7054_g547 [Neopestalotiopsis clavispora]|nr:hypothetical protein G7054_g547 [Neopestalotiopsis clavispora]